VDLNISFIENQTSNLGEKSSNPSTVQKISPWLSESLWDNGIVG
jgi:hypothetical protein